MKILLADDHTLFRDALVQYLERDDPGIEIFIARDFYESSEILKKDPLFDLVLLDFRMPGMQGHEGLRVLKERYPDLQIGLMSGVAESEDIIKAMDMGAAGYFPKTLSGKALLQAIQLVLSGQCFMPLDNSTRMMPSYYADSAKAKEHAEETEDAGDGVAKAPNNLSSIKTIHDIKLTAREEEVLGYLMKGQSNKEIARDLGLQVVTVKLHVRGICRKLNVKNRTQAAMQARELGLATSA